jgi:hypothetical protein
MTEASHKIAGQVCRVDDCPAGRQWMREPQALVRQPHERHRQPGEFTDRSRQVLVIRQA